MFKKRESVTEIEEGSLLSPKFDNDGLIPVITTCMNTKEILSYAKENCYIIDIKSVWNKKISSKLKDYWCL